MQRRSGSRAFSLAMTRLVDGIETLTLRVRWLACSQCPPRTAPCACMPARFDGSLLTGALSVDPDANTRTANTLGGNTGNKVGSKQGDNYQNHNHYISLSGNTQFDGVHSHGIERDDGVEIRWGDGGGSSSSRIDSADTDGSDPRTLSAASAGSHRPARR